MALTLSEIVAALGGQLHGDPAVTIAGLAPLESAGAGELAFLSNPKYRQQLAASQAACVIVGPAMQAAALARPAHGGACIVTPDPYLYFARLTQLWRRASGRGPKPGIHPSAVVDAEAIVDPTASIGPLCVVERGARIGAHTVLKSRVTVSEDCRIGARCLLHPGVVIGADGFGFAPNAGAWEKIEQLGAVSIGDDVEIGANTCIDRGALQDTVIEDGVKLDNLIQIGHNVRIGKHSALAGCSAVAGSATIGAHCTVGGAGMVLGHLTLADNVHISAASLATRSLLKPGQYSGVFPIDDNANWEKNAATLRQLHKLRDRLRALEKSNEQRLSEP
ncbi:UDP-3-O-(3-hydroxymyristoyl)glucosamine N-acyltransferase [Rhodoferax koreense]|uniref:UDP-3-O-acylglucosamine N-acyltransferase n=1 Tax=Rhodoferax koreensis TaxID=1842727 RepID=A0A1P8JZJ2_9BURK|nr:UDP-3-O-(3-hydroxymyristoyl)glucosamine N-acyltransferase [Rhodoferax koreense]APW39173.1 UDP-3-O-(3-hydroxymyristoyl)glucosamine N-acyltransferase [Rhodoferax koreense]